MPIMNKITYGVDLFVLGIVIYSGITDQIGVAIAGLGIYAIGQVIDNIKLESDSYLAKD